MTGSFPGATTRSIVTSSHSGSRIDHAVAQVDDAVALDDLNPLEPHAGVPDVVEVADSLAQQHRHEVDAYLIEQAEVEALLRHVRPGDPDSAVAGRLCLPHSAF